MSKDTLTTCPCGKSDACYQQELGVDYTIHQCYGCGFTTNTLMTEGNEFLSEQIEVLPELYKDLMFTDEEGYYWMPSAINNPEKGMVYADGSSANDWAWAAIKAISIPPSERERFPIPGQEGKFYEYKMDMDSIRKFTKQDFIEALDYIEAFSQKQPVVNIGSTGSYPAEPSEK